MDRELAQKLRNSFHELRNQVVQSEEPSSRPKKPRKKSFVEKYMNLEEEIDNFNALDLSLFFQTKAEESGIKYVIANKVKDAGIFKNLLSKYKAREICLMIEFLFNSDQNYLDKHYIQPTVLASSYCNKIYHDSLLWVNDQYVPKTSAKKSKPTKLEREWNKKTEEKNSAKIGGWE